MTKEELEKENADLKEEINKIAFARGNLEEENAELKADNDARKFAMAMSEKVEKQLRKENAELRKDKEELCHSISEGGKACVYLNGQLTNAKEIIRDLMSFSVQLCDCRHTVDFEKTREEACQFLSEVEK